MKSRPKPRAADTALTRRVPPRSLGLAVLLRGAKGALRFRDPMMGLGIELIPA